MRSVLWHFLATLLHNSQVVPLCLVARNCTTRATNQCTLYSNVHFCDFYNFCLFLQRGGSNMVTITCKLRDMAGKIPTTFTTSCNRPTALYYNLPFSLLSTFHYFVQLQFSLFSLFFLQFFNFSPLYNYYNYSHNFLAFFLQLLSLPLFTTTTSRHVSL